MSHWVTAEMVYPYDALGATTQLNGRPQRYPRPVRTSFAVSTTRANPLDPACRSLPAALFKLPTGWSRDPGAAPFSTWFPVQFAAKDRVKPAYRPFARLLRVLCEASPLVPSSLTFRVGLL